MFFTKQAENRQKLMVFSFQSGNKAAKRATFLFFPSGDKVARIDALQSDDKARKNVFKQARIYVFIPCQTGKIQGNYRNTLIL
ncbi:hypothetical protein [Candidatus Avelusimicrobium faecicola]|uniref:hypothetical protein n=1 Tax=Candidatus Avelusimicrobium faecicola TaxID=3416205 RepID=UPI003D0C3C98